MRVLAALTLGSLVFGAVFGAAASLGTVAANLGAGGTTVTACDSNGFTISFTVAFDAGPDNRWEATGATVGGIAATCTGGALRLTVASMSGAALASAGAVVIDSTSEVVDLVPDPPAAGITGAHIVVVGP